MRRTLVLVSFIFALQIIFLPSAEATSWKGTPWEGRPWHGNPWEGSPWDADDSTWEGNPWEGESWEGSQPEGSGSGEDAGDGTGTDGEGATTEGDDSDKKCLPEPTNNDPEGLAPRSSADVPSSEKDQMLKNVMEKTKFPWFTSKKAKAKYEEAVKEAIDHMLERPYGTVNDIDIPIDVLSKMADAGYSDEKLTDESRPNDRTKEAYGKFLAKNGWDEVDNRSHFSGFEGRAFVNEEDGTIAISFGGTEHVGDYLVDGKLAFGRDSKQFAQAVQFAKDMMEYYPDYEPVLVGHSLGGALAQHVSGLSRIPAVTWNAPGIGTREYSYDEVWVEDGFWKNLGSASLKTVMKEGSLNPILDQLNRNQLLDDLIVNHVMENDEIGTYQIHLGQTRIYSDDGSVEMRYDYSQEAHERDLPYSKITRVIGDLKDGLPSHGVGQFLKLMFDCF